MSPLRLKNIFFTRRSPHMGMCYVRTVFIFLFRSMFSGTAGGHRRCLFEDINDVFWLDRENRFCAPWTRTADTVFLTIAARWQPVRPAPNARPFWKKKIWKKKKKTEINISSITCPTFVFRTTLVTLSLSLFHTASIQVAPGTVRPSRTRLSPTTGRIPGRARCCRHNDRFFFSRKLSFQKH